LTLWKWHKIHNLLLLKLAARRSNCTKIQAKRLIAEVRFGV
jgi:hypothetical protein